MIGFMGRLHPLLVHLPIGILLFAAVLMLVEKWRKIPLEPAVSLAWAVGSASAVVACATGWLLAQSGEYEADLVQKHQYLGLLTAALSALAFWAKEYRWGLGIATLAALTLAGHFGATLTHGEDFLSLRKPKPEPQLPETQTPTDSVLAIRGDTAIRTGVQTQVRRTFVYRDQVVPILKARCYTCHSAAKMKGGLRLDTEAFIRKGGKNGAILTAGKPQKSKLFTYLLLPEDDDRHMPPKGKYQLTRSEIGVLYQWIQTGASFREQVEIIEPTTAVATVATPIPDFPAPLSPDTANANPIRIAPAAETPNAGTPTAEEALLRQPIDAPDSSALNLLKNKQIAITKLTPTANYLSANFVNVKHFQPDLLADLAPIRLHLTQLRLTGKPVTDADINRIATFRNLTRLNLENTNITDAALTSLSALPNLEQLNLYGTAITDAGLEAVKQYPRLKVLHLWQTQTTAEGIEKLRKAKPNLKIETGSLQLTRPDTNKAK